MRIGSWAVRTRASVVLLAGLLAGAARAQVDDWPVRLRLFRAAQTARARGQPERAASLYRKAAALPRGTPPLQRRVLDRLNEHRLQAMVVPVMPHPAVQRAAEAHAGYLQRHTRTRALSLAEAHGEVPGTEGFTGKSVGLRLLHQGIAGGSTETVTSETDPEGAVDILMNSVYHRSGLLRQEARYAGFAATVQAVIDLYWEAGSQDEVTRIHYPGPGQEDVPPRFPGGETPDPLPGVAYPVGPPLSIGGSGTPPEVVEHRLEGPAGPVPMRLLDAAHAPLPELLGDFVYLMPLAPLEPETRYRARVTVKGGRRKAETLDWSFTTGTRVPGEQWVRLVRLEMPRQDLRPGKRVKLAAETAASHPELLRITWTVDGRRLAQGPSKEVTWTATPGRHSFGIRLDYPTESAAFMERSFSLTVPGAGGAGGDPGDGDESGAPGEFEVDPPPPWKSGATVHLSARPLPGEAGTYTFYVNGRKIAEGPSPRVTWKADGTPLEELKVEGASGRHRFTRTLTVQR